ncbi:MAG: hypothetical protein JGK37_19565 [Microcoleus sp. PH2017_06_SFM_O_A]|nr:hypothetical protein [Microcoleus sp. PH2017_06_SFM_O_A]
MHTINSDFSDNWCEPPERIKRSFLDYVRQGIMLYTVQRYRLYKQKYVDFAEYCKLALGRSPKSKI